MRNIFASDIRCTLACQDFRSQTCVPVPFAVSWAQIPICIDSSAVSSRGGLSICVKIFCLAWKDGGKHLGHRFFPGPVKLIFAKGLTPT